MGEEQRGQLQLTESDFELVEDVINNYDAVEVDEGTHPLVIKYRKQYENGIIIYIEEVRTGRKELALKTMYKRKVDNVPDEHLQKPSSDTSVTTSGSVANLTTDKSNESEEIREADDKKADELWALAHRDIDPRSPTYEEDIKKSDEALKAWEEYVDRPYRSSNNEHVWYGRYENGRRKIYYDEEEIGILTDSSYYFTAPFKFFNERSGEVETFDLRGTDKTMADDKREKYISFYEAYKENPEQKLVAFYLMNDEERRKYLLTAEHAEYDFYEGYDRLVAESKHKIELYPVSQSAAAVIVDGEPLHNVCLIHDGPLHPSYLRNSTTHVLSEEYLAWWKQVQDKKAELKKAVEEAKGKKEAEASEKLRQYEIMTDGAYDRIIRRVVYYWFGADVSPEEAEERVHAYEAYSGKRVAVVDDDYNSCTFIKIDDAIDFIEWEKQNYKTQKPSAEAKAKAPDFVNAPPSSFLVIIHVE